MNPISAITFVHNEANNIGKCLELIKPYVDEILVLDLESTDKTGDIALQYTPNVFRRPYLLCGDSYKMDLAGKAKNKWVLWFYPDERFPEKTMSFMGELIKSEKWNSYAFMRHEYIDDVRVAYNDAQGNKILHGTPDSPNYQNRLHKLDGNIFYTELAHAELHGRYKTCLMPADYYFEHRKTRGEQDYDNWRTYTFLKSLVWKYRDTKVEPYKTYIDSYKKIIADSEDAMRKGNREPHLAEECWWEWWKYEHLKRGQNLDGTGLELYRE